jgi:hypothetical protein
VNIWWSFKCLFGSLSDCHPIYGYRRRPYILIGWTVVIAVTVVMMALGQPHPGDPEWRWIICLFFINLFYVAADVATDSIMCDMAQREPLLERGQLQTSYYLIRAITGALTSGVVSVRCASLIL